MNVAANIAAIGSRLLRTRGLRPRRRSEAVRMEARRFGYFPQSFIWRGKRYNVHAVEQCWTVSRRWIWDVERHCFRMRCAEGRFELHQNVKHNTWHVDHFERA